MSPRLVRTNAAHRLNATEISSWMRIVHRSIFDLWSKDAESFIQVRSENWKWSNLVKYQTSTRLAIGIYIFYLLIFFSHCQTPFLLFLFSISVTSVSYSSSSGHYWNRPGPNAIAHDWWKSCLAFFFRFTALVLWLESWHFFRTY